MDLDPKTRISSAIHVAKDDFTGIAGFDPSNEYEAKARVESGITTVEMTDGKLQAAQHVMDDSLNTEAQLSGFKAAIPTEWRDASLAEALELRANGVTVVIRAGLVLVPVSTSKKDQ